MPRALAIALVLALCASAAADEPLREEEIVRRFVAGVPATDLIEAIRSAETAFTLEPEMLEELRLAGLPPAVIDAMVERQRAIDAPAHPDEPEEAAEPQAVPSVTLQIWPEEDGERVLRVPRQIGSGLAAALDLDPAEREFTDLAFYVACITPDHVPDHWRSKSPLGRDFHSMPRHAMLVFLPGARAIEPRKRRRAAMLELSVPARIDAPLPEPDAAHDLIVGLAAEAAGRFFRITDERIDEVTVQEDAAPLAIVLGREFGSDLPTIRRMPRQEEDDEGDAGPPPG